MLLWQSMTWQPVVDIARPSTPKRGINILCMSIMFTIYGVSVTNTHLTLLGNPESNTKAGAKFYKLKICSQGSIDKVRMPYRHQETPSSTSTAMFLRATSQYVVEGTLNATVIFSYCSRGQFAGKMIACMPPREF